MVNLWPQWSNHLLIWAMGMIPLGEINQFLQLVGAPKRYEKVGGLLTPSNSLSGYLYYLP